MPSAVVDKRRGGAYVIPAQHKDRLSAIWNGDEAAPVPMDRIIQQVFSSDYNMIYDIPANLIMKLANCDKATRLVLCSNFSAEDPLESCPCGDKCKFVHADTRNVKPYCVHINYAWITADSVTYERFAAGRKLRVATPKGKLPNEGPNGPTSPKSVVDEMDSSMALKTKALESNRRPLSHCAHYYFNRTCNLGPECQFIHAVFIDPNAKPHQRAPAPTQIGRPMRIDRSVSDDSMEVSRDPSRGQKSVTPTSQMMTSPPVGSMSQMALPTPGATSTESAYGPTDGFGCNTLPASMLAAGGYTPPPSALQPPISAQAPIMQPLYTASHSNTSNRAIGARSISPAAAAMTPRRIGAESPEVGLADSVNEAAFGMTSPTNAYVAHGSSGRLHHGAGGSFYGTEGFGQQMQSNHGGSLRNSPAAGGMAQPAGLERYGSMQDLHGSMSAYPNSGSRAGGDPELLSELRRASSVVMLEGSLNQGTNGNGSRATTPSRGYRHDPYRQSPQMTVRPQSPSTFAS